jgi:diguanylate cyclase (GGDEF)-like protein
VRKAALVPQSGSLGGRLRMIGQHTQRQAPAQTFIDSGPAVVEPGASASTQPSLAEDPGVTAEMLSWRRLTDKRLRQALTVCTVGMLCTTLVALLRSYYNSSHLTHDVLITLLIGTGVMAALCAKAYRTASAVTGATAMLVLMATTATIAFVAEGASINVLMVFPVVLVVAVVFATRTVYRALVGAVLLTVGAIYAIELASPASPRDLISHLSDAAYPVILLICLAVCLELLASDLRRHGEALRRAANQAGIAAAQLHHARTHDPLTGLANRMLLNDLLDAALKGAKARDEMLVVAEVDIIDLGLINETLGVEAGDAALCEAAAALRRFAGESGIVARWGSTQFLVVLSAVESHMAAGQRAAGLVLALREAARVGDLTIRPRPAVGVAVYPADAKRSHQLIRMAERACQEACVNGANTYRFFDETMNIRSEDEARLIAGLGKALEQGGKGLYLAYQPLVELATGNVIGVEALVRWRNAYGAEVSPAVLIPLAEASGLIVQLGGWVLRQAAFDAASWEGDGITGIKITINVSSHQFQQNDLASQVEQALNDVGLVANRLVLEFTESLVIRDTDAVRAMITKLRGMGVHFAIDDFGTGYSNLGYLQAFDIETLKIDRSFVSKVTNSTKDAAMVQAIIQIGAALGMEVIAEGVENAAEVECLTRMGCHLGQGFYWAKPLSGDDFVRLMSLSRRFVDLSSSDSIFSIAPDSTQSAIP